MPKTSALDASNQAIIYIPQDDSAVVEDCDEDNHSGVSENVLDFADGAELRFNACQEAWSKCFFRIQEGVRALYNPVTKAVVQDIRTAYDPTNVVPGLSYPELPVVSVSGLDEGLLDDVLEELTRASGPQHEGRPSRTSHIYPADCSNIASGMKSLMGAFVNQDTSTERPKRPAGQTVSHGDFSLLEAWYTAHWPDRPPHPSEVDYPLVVIMHEFEQFDPLVVQDIFYICRLHVPKIPLLFLLCLSGPKSPTAFLQDTYTQRTRALLRANAYTFPRGMEVIQNLIRSTFFDASFPPPVMIGPPVLNFIESYCERHSQSLDSLTTAVQLAYLRHSEEILSFLSGSYSSEHLADMLVTSFPSSQLFFDALLARIHTSDLSGRLNFTSPSEPARNVRMLLGVVDIARKEFEAQHRSMCTGLCMIDCVTNFLKANGHKMLDAGSEREGGVFALWTRAVKGKVTRDVEMLAAAVEKLDPPRLHKLLEKLHDMLTTGLGGDSTSSADNAAATVSLRLATFKDQEEYDSSEVGDWLAETLTNAIVDLSQLTLNDIWYTGNTVYPSEQINPSVRASMISALLHPHRFASENEDAESMGDDNLWDLPDTSILFRLYLDSGRLINVYDWFESFAGVLENQAEHCRGKRRKGGDEDAEEIKEERQARFVRAVHELDYMGFLRHTGRKAGHVVRTAFDLPD